MAVERRRHGAERDVERGRLFGRSVGTLGDMTPGARAQVQLNVVAGKTGVRGEVTAAAADGCDENAWDNTAEVIAVAAVAGGADAAVADGAAASPDGRRSRVGRAVVKGPGEARRGGLPWWGSGSWRRRWEGAVAGLGEDPIQSRAPVRYGFIS